MITVNGNDLNDIRSQIGDRAKSFDIAIKWRHGDYGRDPKPGCVIDATAAANVTGHTVPLEFDDYNAALVYLRALFVAHKKWVAEQIKLSGG